MVRLELGRVNYLPCDLQPKICAGVNKKIGLNQARFL